MEILAFALALLLFLPSGEACFGLSAPRRRLGEPVSSELDSHEEATSNEESEEKSSPSLGGLESWGRNLDKLTSFKLPDRPLISQLRSTFDLEDTLESDVLKVKSSPRGGFEAEHEVALGEQLFERAKKFFEERGFQVRPGSDAKSYTFEEAQEILDRVNQQNLEALRRGEVPDVLEGVRKLTLGEATGEFSELPDFLKSISNQGNNAFRLAGADRNAAFYDRLQQQLAQLRGTRTSLLPRPRTATEEEEEDRSAEEESEESESEEESGKPVIGVRASEQIRRLQERLAGRLNRPLLSRWLQNRRRPSRPSSRLIPRSRGAKLEIVPYTSNSDETESLVTDETGGSEPGKPSVVYEVSRSVSREEESASKEEAAETERERLPDDWTQFQAPQPDAKDSTSGSS